MSPQRKSGAKSPSPSGDATLGKRATEAVKERYARIASGENVHGPTCCGPHRGYALEMGYNASEIEGLPQSVVDKAAGCHDPVTYADLREGETVVDLGSGAGIDVFLAAKKVGASGKVIGVDMTEEMKKEAESSALKLGFSNVEFRRGEIENLPVSDSSADVVISNCVINLSSDKGKVFQEAFRVLKPGGRLVVADIAKTGELPKHILEDPKSWAGCISGTVMEEEYLQMMKKPGFKEVLPLDRKKNPYYDNLLNMIVKAVKD